jgi:hypothetical protein
MDLLPECCIRGGGHEFVMVSHDPRFARPCGPARSHLFVVVACVEWKRHGHGRTVTNRPQARPGRGRPTRNAPGVPSLFTKARNEFSSAQHREEFSHQAQPDPIVLPANHLGHRRKASVRIHHGARSGAGKSTLLSVIGHDDHSWEGEYNFPNQPVHQLKPKDTRRRSISVPMWDFVFLPTVFICWKTLTVAGEFGISRFAIPGTSIRGRSCGLWWPTHWIRFA